MMSKWDLSMKGKGGSAVQETYLMKFNNCLSFKKIISTIKYTGDASQHSRSPVL